MELLTEGKAMLKRPADNGNGLSKRVWSASHKRNKGNGSFHQGLTSSSGVRSALAYLLIAQFQMGLKPQ
jgi:hypothetical protein